jgi:hypothetical protein
MADENVEEYLKRKMKEKLLDRVWSEKDGETKLQARSESDIPKDTSRAHDCRDASRTQADGDQQRPRHGSGSA